MNTKISLVLKLFLCCCFVGVAYGRSEEEIRAWFVSLAMECNKDIAITGEEMAMLLEHKIPESEHPKCLLNCVFSRSKWMNDKGLFDVDAAVTMTEQEHALDAEKFENSKKLFDLCKQVNEESVSDGEKGCQRAALLTKCLIENAPKFGFKMISI